MLVWLTLPFFNDFAVLDPSPLTMCINCSFLHLYLYSLIFIQRHRSTRSSSVVTLAWPPLSSSLLPLCFTLSLESALFVSSSTTFWYQFFHFWLTYRRSIPSPITSSSSDSPLCTSITPFLFHFRLKTDFFHKSYTPRSFTSSSQTASTDYCLDRFFWSTRFLFLFFLIFSFLGRALD